MMTTTKAVGKARAEVARLMEVEADFSRQRARKQELAKGVDLGEETLAATLAGDDKAAARAANKAAKAAAEAEASASPIVAARHVRESAIVAAWQAEVALKRQEAETFRVTAGALQAEGDVLLARLKDKLGVLFVPGPRAELLAVGRDVGLAQPLRYGIDAAPTQVDVLKVRASGLDEEAAELEGREVSRAGSASGADVAGLFAAVAADPFRIGPTLDELTQWAQTAEAAAREAWQAPRWRDHLDTGDASWSAAGLTFTVMWRAGVIVPGESSCVVTRQPAGVPPREGNPAWVAGASYSV